MLHSLARVADRTNSLDTSATFQDPMLVALWIAVGVAGLLAGIIAVSIADRRRRAEPAPRVSEPAVMRSESELLSPA
ncbi:MAG: hypothetical protein RI885_254 [Actinomycetota bacterium]